MTHRELFKALMNQVLVFAGFAALCAGPVCYLWMGTLSVWWLLAWFPVFILMYFVRQKLRLFWLFLFIHAALVALPVVLFQFGLFPALTLTALLLIAVVTALFSFFYRYHPLPVPYILVWPGCVAALGCAVFSARFPAPGLMDFESVCVILLLSFTPLLRQMERLDESVQVLEHHQTTMTKEHLLRQNNLLSLGYTALIIIISSLMPLIAQGAFTHLLNRLGSTLLAALRFLFGLFDWKEPISVSVSEIPPESYGQAPLEFENGNSLLSTVLGFIWQALTYAVLIAVVAGGLYALIRIILFLQRHFQSTRNVGGDLIESLGKKDAVKRKVRKRRKPGPDFGTGEERRIRKLYYRTVRRHKGPLPRPCETPQEILNQRRDIAGLDTLTKDYNQVRYNPDRK